MSEGEKLGGYGAHVDFFDGRGIGRKRRKFERTCAGEVEGNGTGRCEPEPEAKQGL